MATGLHSILCLRVNLCEFALHLGQLPTWAEQVAARHTRRRTHHATTPSTQSAERSNCGVEHARIESVKPLCLIIACSLPQLAPVSDLPRRPLVPSPPFRCLGPDHHPHRSCSPRSSLRLWFHRPSSPGRRGSVQLMVNGCCVTWWVRAKGGRC